MVFLSWLLVGCSSEMETKMDGEMVSPTEHPIAEQYDASAAVANTMSREEMIRLFSMRDGGPACSDLPLDKKSGLTDLAFIVENVKYPAVTGMRAAECLIDLFPVKGEERFVAWMQRDNTKGLAILLTSKLEDLPKEVSDLVREAGLKGPHRAEVSSRISK